MSGKFAPSRVGIEATVVTPSGKTVTGTIIDWTGPAECVVSPDGSANRTRGVLLEAWQRRQERAS